MKKFFFSWIETYAIGSFMIGSIITILAFIILSLVALFNIKPYIKLSSSTIGFTDFEKGIPVQVDYQYHFPDTAIYGESGKRSAAYTTGMPYSIQQKKSFDSLILPQSTYLDTLSTRYWRDPFYEDNFFIKDASVTNGTIHVQTESIATRLKLLFPSLLIFLVAAYSMWQTGLLLDGVTRGKAFEKNNFKRLRNVGLVIALLQLLLILFSGFFTIHFEVSLNSSNLHQPPISLSGDTDSANSGSWLLIGTALFILAYAFKRGTELQEEQALTV